MTEQEARRVIADVTGPMDRPWDTRCAVALYWTRRCPLPEDPAVTLVEEAATTLGYPLVELNPDAPGITP